MKSVIFLLTLMTAITCFGNHKKQLKYILSEEFGVEVEDISATAVTEIFYDLQINGQYHRAQYYYVDIQNTYCYSVMFYLGTEGEYMGYIKYQTRVACD